jgi:hypothetical protein
MNDLFANAKESVVTTQTNESTEDLAKSLDFIKQKNEISQELDRHKLATGTYKKLFWAICIYVILILILLAGNKSYFQLTDSVLIALLTTTTANIIGIFAIASKWVYQTR